MGLCMCEKLFTHVREKDVLRISFSMARVWDTFTFTSRFTSALRLQFSHSQSRPRALTAFEATGD